MRTTRTGIGRDVIGTPCRARRGYSTALPLRPVALAVALGTLAVAPAAAQPASDVGREEHPASKEPGKKWAAAPDGAPEPGTREVPWVHFVHLYTAAALPVFGEQVGTRSFAWLMRCRATGRTTEFDPRLAPLVLAAAKALHGTVVEVLSGYRSEKFNEQLRKKGHEVASESLHRRGLALDWRLQSVPLVRLTAWLKRKHHGGLGTYRHSNFVHTDFGPEREWRGR
ncbi:MAG: YcbK family protein [Deltaproteobacteria bacterium]|nr:YcbK family protein [Deltaproteobacteria bacterium]